jgi:hypothetical protein
LAQRNRAFIYLVFFIFLCCSCTPAFLKHIDEYKFESSSAKPDYSKLDYWAANPYKRNLSDSVPRPLKNNFIKDSSVDVFFLHPTTFGDDKDARWNADINSDTINSKTDYSTILFQASAFNECRVFAPRYRQAHIRSYYTKDTASAFHAFDLAYLDLKMAFQYYLDHYNNGRPIIIASHSQGSTHAQRLLKEFFDGKPLKNKLVAAYVIGMYIPQNAFTELQPCKDSLQTGCFVGWRSFKKGYEADYVKAEKTKSYVTNPLTWGSVDTYAPRELNKGAVLTNFNTLRPHVADAQIHDGVLWLNRPHFPGSFLLAIKNYHIGDINLFYMNIRENVHARVGAYLKRGIVKK